MSDAPKTYSSERIHCLATVMFIGAFFLFLWLPTMDTLFYKDTVPQVKEKRALAKFPIFQSSLAGMRNFISGLESYYNDHFGFRQRMIYWGERWRLSWFTGTPHSKVMVGQDGWLFYDDEQSEADIRRTTSFSIKQLKAWKNLIEKRRDFLAQRGIHYIFVVPPDKHNIYPEYLPTRMKRVGTTTRLDQFMAYMKTNSTVPVLDLREPLLAAKKNAFVYFSTDTHWNQYGGFIGYQQLMQALSAQMPELKPLPFDSFEITNNQHFEGNLLALLAGQGAPEKHALFFKARPPLQDLVLKKSGAATTVSSTNANATGKALVFRDSFSEAWAPFIGYHFNQVIYRWQYYWDIPFIEKEKPNVVIDELLEHYFYQQNPETLDSE